MTFKDFYDKSDVLLAEDMENDPVRYKFSPEQWHYIRQAQLMTLIKPFTPLMNKLFITKQMRHPLAKMQARVDNLLNNSVSRDDLRLFIYSAHDYQLANVIEFLAPVNHEY